MPDAREITAKLVRECGLRLSLEQFDSVASAIFSAIAAERERCARAICEFCRGENEAEPAFFLGDTWHHRIFLGDLATYRTCAAAAIRASTTAPAPWEICGRCKAVHTEEQKNKCHDCLLHKSDLGGVS